MYEFSAYSAQKRSARGKADVYIEKPEEACSYMGAELGASVRDNIIWKSIATEYIAA